MAGRGWDSTSWKVVRRAYRDTLDYFDTKLKALLIFVVLAALGLAILAVTQGGGGVMSEAQNLLLATVGPSIIFGTVVFLWHLWLAPYEMALEEMRAVKEGLPIAASTPALGPKKPDSYLIGLAGKVRFLGERYIEDRNPLFLMHRRDLEDSTHKIWINEADAQLRRLFLASLHTAKQNIADIKRHAYVQECTTNLAKRLLEAAENG